MVAENQHSVELIVDTKYFDGCYGLHLEYIKIGEPNVDEYGATYIFRESQLNMYTSCLPDGELKVWLCNVVLFIFKKFPNTFYFKKNR